MSATDEVGTRLRAARSDAGLSLSALEDLTHYSKSYLGQVETGERAATLEVVAAYEKALGGAIVGGDMWRKDIKKPGMLIVKGPKDLDELVASLAGGDPGPLVKTATAHWTDIGLAARTDPGTARNLRQWMTDGETSTLRTNALSVIVKLPGQENADLVVRVLANDSKVRTLCLASVVSRVGQFDWDTSLRVARDPSTASNPRRLASKMAKEAVTPKDTQSRWCGAYMLLELASVLGR